MAWHNLDVTPRDGKLLLMCDADECDGWFLTLDPLDFTDNVIEVWRLHSLEDDHNDEIASRPDARPLITADGHVITTPEDP